jgi:aminopeptidase N
LLLGRWFAATKLSSGNARQVFPCFDEPELKAPFEISVAKNDRKMALSNMPIKFNSEM